MIPRPTATRWPGTRQPGACLSHTRPMSPFRLPTGSRWVRCGEWGGCGARTRRQPATAQGPPLKAW
eukprot:2363071-Prymnesium_polylepis.2